MLVSIEVFWFWFLIIIVILEGVALAFFLVCFSLIILCFLSHLHILNFTDTDGPLIYVKLNI